MDDLIDSMRVTLGTAFSLYVKTHAFHWNVEGPDFPQLHALFGAQYEEIHDSIDDIAEHIRALDAYAPMNMERMLALSAIESAKEPLPAREMTQTLLADHEKLIEVLTATLHAADAANKQGIVDFLGGRINVHAKHRWMLRATSKKA